MKPLDYVLLAAVALALFLAVRHIVRRKRAGKCVGCSCDCANCKNREPLKTE